MAEPATTRNMRKVRVGTVISDKADKTIIVRVDRTMSHPVYTKTVKSITKLYAHDEKNEAGVGDVVRLMETRPISKTKHWRLAEIVKKAE